jgi:ribose transport system ATP-binding protein
VDALTLVAERLSKSFSGGRVLDDVSLRLGRGEVVGLIGQNGSGKSTFIKVLSGFHEPDPGARVHMGPDDVTAHLGDGPARTGMAFIHQDLALVPAMTILENLRIARFTTGPGGRIRWRQERALVRAACERVGVTASPDTPVGELSVTDRALVAVARGLSDTTDGTREAEHRLLVLDEPTAYLPADGVRRLFDAVRSLAADGVSILFVSHRLDEVLAHCDRVAVLRGGRLVADVPVEGRTERDLVELMLGRPPEQLYPDLPAGRDGAALRVDDLAGGAVEGVSFAAAPGEIVGFAGLPGHGYDELPYLLAGAAHSRAGSIRVCGDAGTAATALTPARAAALGVALLPADRKAASGAAVVSVGENMTLPTLRRFTTLRVLLRHRRERACVAAELARFAVTPPRGDLPLALLSGGNQQKVLLAKWLLAAPRVLVLHEPTQGVDVGAKRDVFAHLVTLARAGTAVLVSSVEYEDLAHLCHRVHVLRHGRIVATLRRPELSAHAVAEAVHGAAPPDQAGRHDG